MSTALSALNPIPAVITAGGRLCGDLAAAAGTDIKALAPVGGEPLLGRVLRGLQESRRVGKFVVVGPPSLAGELGAFGVLIDEGATGPENIARGLNALGAAEAAGWALLVTCDLPFVDGASIRWLLDHAPDDADVVFPILTRAEYDAALPGSPNTYARLADGEYAGGCVFLVRPAALLRNQALIGQVFDARKRQIAMARLLGLPFVLRFLTGRLTVTQAEARASALTGCRCRALPHAPASLAADVDTLEDYRFVEGVLRAAVHRETAGTMP